MSIAFCGGFIVSSYLRWINQPAIRAITTATPIVGQSNDLKFMRKLLLKWQPQTIACRGCLPRMHQKQEPEAHQQDPRRLARIWRQASHPGENQHECQIQPNGLEDRPRIGHWSLIGGQLPESLETLLFPERDQGQGALQPQGDLLARRHDTLPGNGFAVSLV